ncbi:glutamate-1-semialdehyde 2,1-aminomutase [Rubinisphaera brasiliensis]|uniref:Glutamate-1-semialdehyde 2,1-aminomutase n=1 Tax=Rubinisphaera brasiliensis (strain ATCC 49424 / DSM 5305 / JCM 21570 / IAM 15109 / NBRC 103401 / IFAM 1448) TaxID=756272 RepID=F0SRA3_RUBBR|nr:glutamate-1-semialdehyde 2,1-aminomutase [Rubinisphaera brasiliensis]ADY62354.1 glutamate-1-semialdehyde 2,1-aminomutase [Rubinisphaera brasiliensis DSM 5305]
MERSASKRQIERARKVIPGGVNSPARAFGGVGGDPVVMDRGQGPYLFDIDGNRYIDYIGSWGPHILGHQHPRVLAAIQEELSKGTSFGAPTALETDMAELVCECVPSIEKVRMVNSGTEATMSSIRVARGYTGRNKIIKFAGCYHGHVDSLLVQAGSGALTHGVPSSPGVPEGCTQDTISLEYNDVGQLQETFANQGSEIACVILEPVVGNMGTVIPDQEFLQACRDLCTEHGAVLIFDEVMTGFRLALGGAQERFGITPDMTALGKIIGAGMPVGAYGGKAEIMSVVSPEGPVYQAGTLSGNPVAMASGLAALRQLRDEPPYEKLEEMGQRLAAGLGQAAEKAGIPHQVAQVGSMLTLFFNDQPVRNYSVSSKNNTELFAKFFHGMLDEGMYLPCSQYEAWFVSAAHTDDDIDRTIQAADRVLAGLA